MNTAIDILRKYWGFDKFRKQQDAIIASVLEKKDTLGLLPTGGGKSICYQVPGLLMEGVCLVISPLIALMEDQVQSLKKKGIKAIAINSSLSKREIDIQLDNAIYGNTKFLFVSPERLKSRLFLARMEKMNINLIAVDEAHCISEWGYDFRPAYLEIASIKERLPDTPILALTATATTDVRNDIQVKLKFKEANIFVESFERPNLSYNLDCSNNKNNRLLEFLSGRTDSGIVYANTRKEVKKLTQLLSQENISCTFYHGGLDHETRTKRQNAWTTNEIQLIVATNAFGMGIDKPDVGFVIHMDIPESIEAYFQEAGRAGRNGDQASAHLFYEPADITKLEAKVQANFPPIEFIKSTYNYLGNYFQLATGSGLEETYAFDLLEFCDRFSTDLIETFNAIRILEIAGYFKLSENFSSPAKIKVLVASQALYQFQVRDKNTDRLIQFLLRTHIGIFDELVNFNPLKTMQHTGLNQKELNAVLNYLESNEAMAYIPEQNGTFITYTRERLHERNIQLTPAAYINRKKTAFIKMEAMKQYLQTEACTSSFLLTYFGETNCRNCEKCSNCLRSHRKPLSTVIQKDIIDYLKHKNNTDPVKTICLIADLKSYTKPDIMNALRWLIDHDLIMTDEFSEELRLN